MKITKHKNGVFTLETENLQYAIGAGKDGVFNMHWGAKCPAGDFEEVNKKE